ncbi:hydrogenase expression/formation protein HypE [Eubacterium xylanophilum]|uniref:hydrogenase expression/formation protein HypE n=1 Tax=Eubacterium xylanophilum TaxID=39497 RepID=UPI000479F921|nr:hydrogenase expression/formation protein HypE [Eubacterium xylanophilum]
MARISMEHGSGGSATSKLINKIFEREFDNEILSRMEDAAVLDLESGCGKIAMTTDSFVVTPLIFKGGDIGRLSVCGTVNDLLMRGATPRYLTCGFVLEEGLEIDILERVVHSMAETAREAGVIIVAGDTKVVEGDGGLIINTTGLGFVPDGVDISVQNAAEGDVIIVSGNMGDHHAAILSERMAIENDIESDNAPLVEMVQGMIEAGIDIHVLRDVTRGGLATVMTEIAKAGDFRIELMENAIPVDIRTKDFCGILGLDPLYMGNEGKLVALVPEDQGQKALEIVKNSKYGEGATIIGNVLEKTEVGKGELRLRTSIGGLRSLDILQGEGLPRIC